MNIKMVVSDLDNTLLQPDKSISPRTQEALRRCRSMGIKTAYATGRGGSAQFLAPDELFDGKITMNGAVAKVGDKVVYERLIPYEAARPLLTACQARGIRITSETSGMHYTNFTITDVWPKHTYYEIVDFSRHALAAEKIYVPNPSPEEKQFIQSLVPDGFYSVVTTDVTGVLLQVMHREATKAKAVAALARFWGIVPAEIVAFGDDLNDVDMIAEAGKGVAVGNAFDEVKAVSDDICAKNDEEGVAKWLEQYVLTRPTN